MKALGLGLVMALAVAANGKIYAQDAREQSGRGDRRIPALSSERTAHPRRRAGIRRTI